MEKLKMHSINKVDENIKKIGELFPNCLTERKNKNGEVEYGIDFDVLKQELSDVVVEGNEERYQFTWPDKKKSILLANAPVAKTLRACREESVDFDTTENLYIEGDNLDVLKLLQETYLGKIKMIYIDPPYNTGNDFVYEDDFAQSAGQYVENSCQYDEDGKRLVQNTETNGRFHTDWLNMMYPRLKLAKDLLNEEGLVFISIANQEVGNVKKISDEIFGYSNCLGIISWESKTKCQNTKTAKYQLQSKQEYILVYKKKTDRYEFSLIQKERREYPEKDENGDKYRLEQIGEMSSSGIRGRNTMIFSIDGVYPKEGNQWKYGVDTVNKFRERGDLLIKDAKAYFRIREFDEEDKMEPFWSLISKEIGTAETAKAELKRIIGGHGFETVKPVNMIKKLIFHVCSKSPNAIVLDFFSGSSTTAHATMQLNAEDGGKRKFIMVQIPEETDKKSEAYKAGYKNICEIGKERIRRAGAKIKEELAIDENNLDAGFRVLKLDSTNMKDVYYKPEKLGQQEIKESINNIKEDRTPEDLLFQVMLELGVELSSKIEETLIDGKKVFNVAEGFLMACFDEKVTEKTIKAVAEEKPYYFVTRDSSIVNDSVATNLEQIFEIYSPDTVKKVL